MLVTKLCDQKTILQLSREELRQQPGHKTSGEEAADENMASSGKAKHTQTPTTELWE